VTAPSAIRTLELSCYTTNLVAYLCRDGADDGLLAGAERRLAHAVRLAVRTDLPGAIAFSHHERIDRTPDGGELAYRGAASWEATRTGLAAELELNGVVLAVGNTRHLPWSPQYGRSALPHWILLEQRKGSRWQVTDHFAALLPTGEQLPYAGWLAEVELRRALTPSATATREVLLRDMHALGTAVAVPPSSHYRWLVRRSAGPPYDARPHTWLVGPVAVLEFLARRLATDERLLAQHADDLWAAARHHRHRLSVLAGAGLIPAAAAERSARRWSELPRALRFAADSATRGRPRPGVVTQAFRPLLDMVSGEG
jgi:hypothetical protein